MTDEDRIDRRRHQGPWRFLHISLSALLKRLFGWDSGLR